jgi:hypothetical protein
VNAPRLPIDDQYEVWYRDNPDTDVESWRMIECDTLPEAFRAVSDLDIQPPHPRGTLFYVVAVKRSIVATQLTDHALTSRPDPVTIQEPIKPMETKLDDKEIKRTFYEWNTSGEFPFKVIDPDGFPRHDVIAMETTRYTRQEFLECAQRSTVQPLSGWAGSVFK